MDHLPKSSKNDSSKETWSKCLKPPIWFSFLEIAPQNSPTNSGGSTYRIRIIRRNNSQSGVNPYNIPNTPNSGRWLQMGSRDKKQQPDSPAIGMRKTSCPLVIKLPQNNMTKTRSFETKQASQTCFTNMHDTVMIDAARWNSIETCP